MRKIVVSTAALLAIAVIGTAANLGQALATNTGQPRDYCAGCFAVHHFWLSETARHNVKTGYIDAHTDRTAKTGKLIAFDTMRFVVRHHKVVLIQAAFTLKNGNIMGWMKPQSTGVMRGKIVAASGDYQGAQGGTMVLRTFPDQLHKQHVVLRWAE